MMDTVETLSTGSSTSSKFRLESCVLPLVRYLTHSVVWTAISMASRAWCL